MEKQSQKFNSLLSADSELLTYCTFQGQTEKNIQMVTISKLGSTQAIGVLLLPAVVKTCIVSTDEMVASLDNSIKIPLWMVWY